MNTQLLRIEPANREDTAYVTEAAPGFAADVIAGLGEQVKRIPCTWLYDRRGSELFEQITAVPEYYPTRTEMQLLAGIAPSLHAEIGDVHSMIEIGSGASRKTRLLLSALPSLRRYVPVDISAEFLLEATAGLKRDYPAIAIEPLVADFTHPFALPAGASPAHGGRLGFFPGSTIGNFTPDAAIGLMAAIGQALGPRSHLLIGVDTTQDAARLLPAYDDAAGVTAEFNLNLLDRINRELGGNFNRRHFRHLARFDARLGRMEMHLVSHCAQIVHIGEHRFVFAENESIHTENAYKYPETEFLRLAKAAGWQYRRAWRDEGPTGFMVFLLARSGV